MIRQIRQLSWILPEALALVMNFVSGYMVYQLIFGTTTQELAAAAGLVSTMRAVVWHIWESQIEQQRNRLLARLSAGSAVALTALAAALAGRSRPALGDEWRAHLAGETGHDPAAWPKVRQALGFIISAIQMRLTDVVDLAWRPVDAVLVSRPLCNAFVIGPVTVTLIAIVRHDGRFGLVADIQDPIALGAFLYAVIRVGRWWRGIKPSEPKARHSKE